MQPIFQGARAVPGGLRRLLVAALALLLGFVSGCAALTNPIADGVPVRRLSPEFLEKPKDDEQTIPLNLLEQPAPDAYRLAPGDVLGVYVEGVLAAGTQVNVAPAVVQIGERRRLPPAFGTPVPVREDGTLNLPLLTPIRAQGLTLTEVEDTIRDLYTKKQILPAGRERVVVTLMHPRQYHVIVMRQEAGNGTIGAEGGPTPGKRGWGTPLDLPAYENDVLHALAQTGGMPGLDTFNEVIIFRGSRGPVDMAALEKLRNLPPNSPLPDLGICNHITRIPLRLLPGEPLPIHAEDVLLQNGDVVFLEARDQDVFYTAGLLPSGEFALPRDTDLDVIEAISRVKGPLLNGGFGTNNLSGALIEQGIGSPSPSLLTVLRRTPGGGQIPIRVDLNRALRDPRERILVRAGDVLVLQEMPSDAMARYFTQTFFNFSLAWQVLHESFATGVIDISAPQRIPSRISTGSVTSR